MAKTETWWVIKIGHYIIAGTNATCRKYAWVEFWNRYYNETAAYVREMGLEAFMKHRKYQGFRAVKIMVKESK